MLVLYMFGWKLHVYKLVAFSRSNSMLYLADNFAGMLLQD